MARVKRDKSGRFYILEDDGTRREPTAAELAKKRLTQPTNVRPVQRPLSAKETTRTESAVGLKEQFVHDFLALNPDKQVEYMRGLGFEMRRDARGQPMYRRPNDTGTWKGVGKDGFDRGDALNIAAIIGTGAIPGVALARTGLTGGTMLAALGATAGATELGRQAIGQAAGVPGNMSPRAAATSGLLTAALPLAATGAMRGAKAVLRPVTRTTRRLEGSAMSLAARGAGLGDTGIQAEDALAFRMANRQDVPGFIDVADELSRRIGDKGKLIPEGRQAAALARGSTEPTDLRGVIAALDKGVRDGRNSPGAIASLRRLRDTVLNRARRMQGIGRQVELTTRPEALGSASTRTVNVLDDPAATDILLKNLPVRDAQTIKAFLQKQSRFKAGETVDAVKAEAVPTIRKAASAARRAMEATPQVGGDIRRLNRIASEKNQTRSRLLKAIRDEPALEGASPTTESFLAGLFRTPDTQAKQRFLSAFDDIVPGQPPLLEQTRQAQIGRMFGGPGGQPETRIFTTATGGLKGQALAKSILAAAGGATGGALGGVAGGIPGALAGAATLGAGAAMMTPSAVLRSARGVAKFQNYLERLAASPTVPAQNRAWARAVLPVIARATSGPVDARTGMIMDAILQAVGQRAEPVAEPLTP